jgi:protein O-mannosyl-transferase
MSSTLEAPEPSEETKADHSPASDEAEGPVRPSVLAVIIATLSIVVFAPSLGGPFLGDDALLITENPYIRSMRHLPRWFAADFWAFHGDVAEATGRLSFYRPGTLLSFALDWAIGRGSPVVFHVTSLVSHAIVAALAFFTLRRWTGSVGPAVIAALLFAIHPVNAESVALISGRPEILCTLFVLVACGAIARRLRGDEDALPLEVTATLLAYLCGEMAIALPLFAAVEAWIAADRPQTAERVRRTMLLATAPHAAVGAVYAFLRLTSLRAEGPPAWAPELASPSARVELVLESIGRHVELLIVPHDLSLGGALLPTDGTRALFSISHVAAGAVVLLGLGVLTLVAVRRARAVAVPVAFFLVLLAGASIALASTGAVASSRALYLPSFGLAFALAAGIRAVWTVRRNVVAVGAIAGIVALGTIAFRRANDSADEQGFWAHEERVAPLSPEPRLQMARIFAAQGKTQAVVEALGEARRRSSRWVGHRVQEIALVPALVEWTLRGVPDADRRTLRAIDAFLVNVVRADLPEAVLEHPRLSLRVPLADAESRQVLKRLVPKLATLRAEIASRLGYDAQAQSMTATARKECPSCRQAARTSALVTARAGDFGAASRQLGELLAVDPTDPQTVRIDAAVREARGFADAAARAEGAMKTFARAQQESSLFGWGRAFAVLEPHQAEIEKAPAAAVGYAEIAYRAGNENVARDVLRAIDKEGETDALFAKWAESMGWTDPPTPGEAR